MVAALAASATVGGLYGGNRVADRASGVDEAKAALSSKDSKPFAHQPSVVTVPYEVGRTALDQMVSEVASDMHAFAPNQDYTEAIHAIRTYLPPEDQKDYLVHAGQDFSFLVDTNKGQILPNPEASSAPGE